MNVLSLFDGMSCGQIALDRAGIKVDSYFASEIDKYAIHIARKNYPKTIHLGDVFGVSNMKEIDLLIGGSPCQGFSFAGKRLNFDDPRSKLFFEFHRILKESNPTYFLLENVKMSKESVDIITEKLGVEPIKINSSLVSAQNRERLYWTNIPNIVQPEDRGIMLKDIISDDGNTMRGGYRKVTRNKSIKNKQETSRCYQVGETKEIKGFDIIKRVYSVSGKSPSLTTMQGGHREPKIAVNDSAWRKLSILEFERLQTVPDHYTEGVSNTQRKKMIGNGWTIDVVAHIFKAMKEDLILRDARE